MYQQPNPQQQQMMQQQRGGFAPIPQPSTQPNYQPFQQQQFQQQGFGGQPFMQDPMMQFFAMVDTDRSGMIEGKELIACLGKTPCRIVIGDECALAIIRMFSSNKQPKMTPQGRPVWALNFLEFKNAYQYLCQLQAFFVQVDVKKDGTLNPSEMMLAVQKSGFQLEQNVFANVFSHFDRHKRGELSLGEFIEICVFLTTTFGVFRTRTMPKSPQMPQEMVALTFSELVAYGITASN